MSADELREKTGPYGARQRSLPKGSIAAPPGDAAAAMRWTLPRVKLRDGVRESTRAVSRRVDAHLHAIDAARAPSTPSTC